MDAVVEEAHSSLSSNPFNASQTPELCLSEKNEDGSVVQALRLRDMQPRSVVISLPSPLVLHMALQNLSWELDPKWQSSSIIYRVISDLHCRQHFGDIHLAYLPNLRLVFVTGKEGLVNRQIPCPEISALRMQATSSSPGFPVKDSDVMEVTDSLASADASCERSENDTRQPGNTGCLSAADSFPVEESQTPFYSEPSGDFVPHRIPCSRTGVVCFIPGHFRSAALSGRMRSALHTSVARVVASLKFVADDGYVLAITDGDDVSYYVEKEVALDQLMKAGREQGSREAVFSAIFGTSRALNVRSVVRKEERSAKKQRSQERKGKDDVKCGTGQLFLGNKSLDSGTAQKKVETVPAEELCLEPDKYEEVLKFLDKDDHS